MTTKKEKEVAAAKAEAKEAKAEAKAEKVAAEEKALQAEEATARVTVVSINHGITSELLVDYPGPCPFCHGALLPDSRPDVVRHLSLDHGRNVKI